MYPKQDSIFLMILMYLVGCFMTQQWMRMQMQLHVVESEVDSSDSNLEVVQTKNLDTSIVLISNLVPLHPNITHTTAVLESTFEYLEGLPPNTPVFIAVDFLAEPDNWNVRNKGYASNNQNDRSRLQQYISNLRAHYLPMKNVQIVPSVSWGHINHNIGRALELVETKYVYVIQHDYVFKRPIDHKAIVKTFDEYYPKHIWKLEFALNTRTPWAIQSTCYGMKTPIENVNGIQITKQSTWTDQNHFTTKEHYLDVLEGIGPVNRSPEYPMNNQAEKNCVEVGTHLYGGPDDEPYIDHLDGRGSKKSEEAS